MEIHRRVQLYHWATWLLGCIFLCSPLAAWQSTPEDYSLQQMCERGLGTTAIAYAQARRQQAASDPAAYARWTMRLMETHALAARRMQEEENWQASEEVFQAFVSDYPEHARLPWLAWQRARCQLLQTQTAVAEYLAAPAREALREQALSGVREIVRQLDDLEQDIRERQPLAARQSRGGKQAPAEELNQLAIDTVLLRCEALLIRTRLYPPGSPDRIAAATDVDKWSSELLTRTDSEWSSRDQLRVAQASARLELGQSEAAQGELQQIAIHSDNPAARSRAAAAAIENMATAGLTSRAFELLQPLRESGSPAEVALAEMQIELAELEQLSDVARQERLAKLVEQAKQVGEAHGPYWRRRAEALLFGSAALDSSPQNGAVAMELLLVEVRQLLAADDTAGALAKLVQFAQNESAADRSESALQAAQYAAALYQRDADWTAAADLLAPLGRKFSESPQAAKCHLQAVIAVSEALRADASHAALQQRYLSLLQDHIAEWPDDESTDQAQAWLVDWLTAQQQHVLLAAQLLQRAHAAEQKETAVAALLEWVSAVTQGLDPEQRTRQLEKLIQPEDDSASGDWLPRLAPQIRAAAILIADWPLPPQSTRLSAELQGDRIAEDPRLDDLREVLRVLVAVREERVPEKLVDLWKLQNSLPVSLRAALAVALVEAMDELPQVGRGRWLQLLEIDPEWSSELRESRSFAAQAASWRMKAWEGNAEQAIQGLQQLSLAAGRTGGLIALQLASALAEAGRLDESNRIARRLVANTTAGGELHRAARWRYVKNLQLAGDSAAAVKTAKLFLATQPAESGVWRRRFEAAAQAN